MAESDRIDPVNGPAPVPAPETAGSGWGGGSGSGLKPTGHRP